MIPAVVLTPRGKKRFQQKHPWIFSNEIQSKPEVAPGTIVEIRDPSGHLLGNGYYNNHTLIAVRILSYHGPFELRSRIEKAYAFRRGLYREPVYRLIYGESDALPGLIVDRYAQTLVAQILTAGMERLSQEILQHLIQIVQPDRILFRNDSSYRQLEGLAASVEWVYGSPAEEEVVEMDGISMIISHHGQKTGFFLDQRENRKRLFQYSSGEKMLDVFSYSGAWALYGAKAGMKNIIALDSSAEALRLVQKNAELNSVAIQTLEVDAFDFLRERYATPDRYDVIVLDPPAFCKSKKQLRQAWKGYLEINLRAMKLMKPGGILFTCSCSEPVTPDLFEEILRQAATDSGRRFLLREMRFQAPDHPVLLSFPESQYLKCAILQVF